MSDIEATDPGTRAITRPSPPLVYGVVLDQQTRCAHYHTELDIVAIRARCCGQYFGCKDCHDALAGHALEPWPRAEHDANAVLCGACKTELTITAYLKCGSRCPACGVGFNPRCSLHHHFYFALA